jgi:hypothetical protein
MRRADAEDTPTPAAATRAAASSSRRRAPLQQDDVDELSAHRVRVQQRVDGVASGMARAAAATSRSAVEVEERRKRRREQKAACERRRRKAARDAQEADESESEGESEGEEEEGESEGEDASENDGGDCAWQPPSKELRDEMRAQWRGEDDTAEYERRKAERRIDAWAGQPDSEPAPLAAGRCGHGLPEESCPVCYELCPHGFRATTDWKYRDEGGSGYFREFSSNCAKCRKYQLECIGKELARDACETAIAEYHESVGATVGVLLSVRGPLGVRVHLAVGPDGQDPPDPYGTESADCFYDNGSGDRGRRRLAGGLSFALPDEVYGAGQHAGAPEPKRKREPASAVEEPESDWAPWAMVESAGGQQKVIGKSSEYYQEYNAAADVGFALMRHNSLDPRALYRWLDDAPGDAPPVPPPADLTPPPVDPEPLEPPPKRNEYRKGKRGRRAFRRERAEWYERATGEPLEGALEEQNAQFDKVARRFRAYSDYRAHRSVARYRHECAHGPAVVGMGPLPEHLTSSASERRHTM